MRGLELPGTHADVCIWCCLCLYASSACARLLGPIARGAPPGMRADALC